MSGRTTKLSSGANTQKSAPWPGAIEPRPASPAPPGGAEIPAPLVIPGQPLGRHRARRVVGDDAVDRAVQQPGPQLGPVGLVADRRAALELGAAIRHVLGPQG